MKRTQIYLPDKLKKDIAHVADARGISMGEYIRSTVQESITQDISYSQDKGNVKTVEKFLKKVTFSDGPRNLSSKIDQYLYDQ